MKTLFLIVIVALAAKFGFDAWRTSSTDRDMARVVKDMNTRLPMSTPDVRLEQVSYSQRTLRISGRLLGSEPLTDKAKAASRAKLKEIYCGAGPVVRGDVSVEYAFTKTAMASINDKLRADNWELTLRPSDCQ